MLKNKQPTAVSIRATMQQQHLASARNRRLAQQMENRPSVQAALSHKQVRATERPTDSRRLPESHCPFTPQHVGGAFPLAPLGTVYTVVRVCLHWL